MPTMTMQRPQQSSPYRSTRFHWRLAVVLLYTSFLSSSVTRVAAQSQEQQQQPDSGTYELLVPLPELIIKLIVVDDNIDLNAYETQLRTAVTQQLTGLLPLQSTTNSDSATPLHLNQQPFQVVYYSTLKKSFLGQEGNGTSAIIISLMECQLDGNLVLTFSGLEDKLLMEAQTDLPSQLAAAVKASFQNGNFMTFLRSIGTNAVLAMTIKAQIAQDGDVVAQGNVADAVPPNDNDDKGMSATSIAAISIFCVMIFTLLVVICLVKRHRKLALEKKKQAKNWKRTPQDRLEKSNSSMNTEGTFDPQNSGNNQNPDQWMDEMTKKMTSIPIRSVAKESSFKKALRQQQQAAQQASVRPSLRGRGSSLSLSMNNDNLFCITEVHDEEDMGEEGEEDDENSTDECSVEEEDTTGPTKVSDLTVMEEGDEDEDDSENGVEHHGQHHRQFSDADCASPTDYEPRIVNDHIIYL